VSSVVLTKQDRGCEWIFRPLAWDGAFWNYHVNPSSMRFYFCNATDVDVYETIRKYFWNVFETSPKKIMYGHGRSWQVTCDCTCTVPVRVCCTLAWNREFTNLFRVCKESVVPSTIEEHNQATYAMGCWHLGVEAICSYGWLFKNYLCILCVCTHSTVLS
jgi:hypothetical protein